MPQNNPKTAVIIVAAGSGTRLNSRSSDLPKQYQLLDDKTVLEHTINAFTQHHLIDVVLPVISVPHQSNYDALELDDAKLLTPVLGGKTRQSSVLAGLDALQSHNPDVVLIHDAARPFVSAQIITDVIDASMDGGAIPALPVTDTLKFSPDGKSITQTLDRTQHFVAQTPQGFAFAKILSAHINAQAQSSAEFTDDASIAEWANMDVSIVAGEVQNKKITFSQDLAEARSSMNDNNKLETRVGSGYDVHAFEVGNEVILGGIHIPFDKKLKGHSDADAALHTITDAIYGALAEGDIGQHFPPSDDKWKNKDSAVFLEHAISRLSARSARLVNVDLTIICEQPKIGPHCIAMRQNIADICKVSVSRVSVKATTSEKLGFTGRGEGIAAQAIVAIELPAKD
ncbi:bifunctional 2-C-methyl-D-erythritol 4-phosphate cytidylyltransferase/2-C-methyl-D-erythritol 2,4-cyclodiphosphate synthase [Maritalea porphyrae]|uniref:bifunctional 2-C-methyl-D-erythritol 4-phosphate cytidylyltransferase/2-C-methyl-D-erythritol 2,4-cyclodiphosphate synthase n=1 Tax=Maritalea porphyrae TaxID=880732 RepID=UPI0022AEC5A5|nr:bifunctional 2-C-methyl-D-erythritol 4-phosphate cytidylyltransferase/2-C-methyl-D-erythritol 2,4-cyclodiphosphate synthase [Maritalea porphyrae]MCZ4273078.1 bifunctional 2-C-methyl-D-erythritol 4-phosphate cytidylyltransferase/2-C-methyl-D-erythritol 2,4-cyclodiphosphate synthase [Maritalea porphyrae]